MADGEFRHVIPLLPERDEIVIYSGLIFPRVVEVELLRLNIVLTQLLLFKLRNFFQKALFLGQRHAPDHAHAVLEQEHLRDVHRGVEVGCDGSRVDLRERGTVQARVVDRSGTGEVLGLHGRAAAFGFEDGVLVGRSSDVSLG